MTNQLTRTLEMSQPFASTNEPEEADHINRAIAGETRSIDWLITKYRNRVVRLAAGVLGRPSEAEDAAQEAFIRAFRSLASYRRRGNFQSWLFQITVNVCLDRTRLSRWNAEVGLIEADRKTSPADPAYLDTEFKVALAGVMATMSPEMRAILTLRELEDLEYGEIATILQIPVGRVKWRLHMARKELMSLWAKLQSEVNRV